jgi:SanA protein
MNKLKKISLFLLLVLALGLALIWALNTYILQATNSRVYEDIDSLPLAHTVIILGASVHSDGKLSPILQDRVDTGFRLYKNKKVKRFLLSGDNRSSDYDEVNAMRNYLINLGVPPAHIFIDPAGIDTYDSMYRSNAIFEVPSAIVVTQQFHLPRTLFIAKNLGLNYMGFPADSRQYQTESSLLRREKLANLKALYEIVANQKPAGMGKKIPITDTP